MPLAPTDFNPADAINHVLPFLPLFVKCKCPLKQIGINADFSSRTTKYFAVCLCCGNQWPFDFGQLVNEPITRPAIMVHEWGTQ